VVALIGIYLPFFDSRRGAVIGLAAAAVATTIWYLLDNPFGVDNMYVALLTPAIVLVIDKLLFPHQAQSEPSPAVATNTQAASAAQRKAAH
jgi:SSS family solute:Na+ symporter